MTSYMKDGCKTEHTRGAIKAAEVITGEKYGSNITISTAYGDKTTKGIADVIDEVAHVTQLLAALDLCAAIVDSFLNGQGAVTTDEMDTALMAAQSAICKANGIADPNK